MSEVVALLIVGGILLALFLPALLQDRDRDRRRPQCLSNLRQLGIAAQNFHSNKGRLPGYVQSFGIWQPSDRPPIPDDPTADLSTLIKHEKVGTWVVSLLPYMDQQALYEYWSTNRYPIVFGGSEHNPLTSGTAGIGFNRVTAPSISVMQCPSAPDRPAVAGENSYACNVGLHAPVTDENFPRSMSGVNGVFSNQFPGIGPDGAPVPVGPAMRLQDIADGLSMTLLFTENLQALPWHRAGFIDADDLVIREPPKRNTPGQVRYHPTSRYTQGVTWHLELADASEAIAKLNPIHKINSTAAGVALEDMRMSQANAVDLARPSSMHRGGVHITLADGSVRFLSETVDYRVYQSLLAPDDRQSDAPLAGWQLPTETSGDSQP